MALGTRLISILIEILKEGLPGEKRGFFLQILDAELADLDLL